MTSRPSRQQHPLRLSFSPDTQLLFGVLLLIILAFLGACSTGQQQTSIAGLELSLATAEELAQAYRQFPPCDASNSGPFCKNLAIVGNLQALDDKAYTTLKAAERVAASGASVDLTAATAAITAFQAVVGALPKAPAAVK